MSAAAAVVADRQAPPAVLAGEREAIERNRANAAAAARLLIEADSAVVQARAEWLAAGERWAAARHTFSLAEQAAAKVLPDEPVIVRESPSHVRVIRRAGRGVRLERLAAVSLRSI